MNDPETKIYREQLTAALERAGMNSGQIDAITRKFDRLAERNPGLAFATMHSAYGNENTEAACLTVKALIQRELAKLKDVPGPKRLTPLQKLKLAVEQHNANLKKCSVLYQGKELLSEAEIDALKIRLSDVLDPDKKSEAVASVVNLKSRIQNLEVEVRH